LNSVYTFLLALGCITAFVLVAIHVVWGKKHGWDQASFDLLKSAPISTKVSALKLLLAACSIGSATIHFLQITNR
jgi:DMSO/TMAO reductase YedYZ heme-binding membrane subunit